LGHALQDLQAWNVSIIAQTGLQFDLTTPQGKLIASMMAALAEFERDLLRERILSGIATARAKGKSLGRPFGFRPKSDRISPKVLQLVKEGRSYRQIARELDVCKNTVLSIVQRSRAEG
jgi:DNA invertase Pin-like site-specific DNA recombinase